MEVSTSLRVQIRLLFIPYQFIEALNELDTEKVEPLTSVADTKLRLREDKFEANNIRDKILKNSPDENKDYFVVPKVVE